MQEQYTDLVLDNSGKASYQYGMNPLKKYREAKKLTQARLAEMAGTSQPQIQRLESTEREMSKKWAEKLAPLLDVRAAQLLFDDQMEPDHHDAESDPADLPGNVEDVELWREAYREAREIEAHYTGGRRGRRITFGKMIWIIYEEKLSEKNN